jgi:acyl-CoA dehydrogenase
MDLMFEPSDTQAQLRDSLQRWLDQRLPFVRRAAVLANPGALAPLWQGLAHELGLLGAALPESLGGQGGGLSDQLVIARALGGALLPEPWLSTAVLGAGLLQRLGGAPTCAAGGSASGVADAAAAAGSADHPAALLRGIADGRVRTALATLEPHSRHDVADPRCRLLPDAGGALRLHGRKTVVRAAPWATHWLVTARDAAGLLCVALLRPDAPGVRQRELPLADGSWAAELSFDGAPAQRLAGPGPQGDASAALQHTLDEATLATSAEAVGVMERLLRDTLDHVRQRHQFGVPLASFQVLQHRLADMHLALVQAGALVGATLAEMDAAPAERQRAVASLQVTVLRAARCVGQGAVQLHGGMGMTDELAVGHGFKRLTVIEQQFGPLARPLRQVVRLTAQLTAQQPVRAAAAPA